MPHDAFLSFAEPDKELATCLSALFGKLGRDAFAWTNPRADDRKTTELRRSIIEEIRESHCFLPIYTPRSVRREWVLYESGVADAFKKKRFPARSAGVAPSEILDLPVANDIVYDLSDREDLARLIIKVCVNAGEAVQHARERVQDALQNDKAAYKLADKVVILAKRRWVFVAGNYPENARETARWAKNPATYRKRLKLFSERLTEELMEQGFSVRACPQVKALGMHVTAKAAAYLDDPRRPPHVDFGIGGIHPIDREARRFDLSDKARKQWRDHIMEFRKSYLETQEWLILLGGNEGTQEEYEAADKAKVKVVTIPCFGGKAAELHTKGIGAGKGPCGHCAGRNGACGQKQVRELVADLARGTARTGGNSAGTKH